MGKGGAKKKGKKSKKGGGDNDDGEGAATSQAPPPPSMLLPDVENYVTLEMNLMNWRFMNFKMRIRTETHLFTVKNTLAERHGRIKDLVICKDSFAEKNEMREDMRTLADYGIFGAPEDKEPVSVQIYYEFKPCDHDDPLLLHMGGE